MGPIFDDAASRVLRERVAAALQFLARSVVGAPTGEAPLMKIELCTRCRESAREKLLRSTPEVLAEDLGVSLDTAGDLLHARD